MTTPHDRESLLAAWEAIGPSNPFPTELQGICLAYFKNSQQHGNSGTETMPTPDDELFSPPTRYVRHPRASRKAPAGPLQAECFEYYPTESSSSSAVPSVGHEVELLDQPVNGPDDDQIHVKY